MGLELTSPLGYFPGRTLEKGTCLGLSGSLGDFGIHLLRNGFLTPWAVDKLAARGGGVANWPIILPTFRWGRSRHGNLKLGGAKLL